MPIRRRRNIRAYVKIGIGIVVFLFFVSLIQFMGQIDTPGESPRHRHYHRHEESEAKGINAEKNIDDERLNRLRDRVVASGFKSNNDRGDANAGQDSDMNFYEFKRTMTSLQKLVHLDLKGSPPKLAYLKEFLPFAKSAGATGVLIEYEDFFPYKNDLEAVANQNHYTPNELKQLFDLLKENKMSVIPLVQTYGHLEFVLKLKQFAYLREASEHFQVISPCLNDTYEKVVFRMIDQILDAHPTDIEYIHIGCDEVYHVNVNEACKSMTNLKNIHDFFIFHVNKIVDYIKLKRPDLRVMIWEDMIRKNMLSQVDDDLSKLARKIVPVVWNYRENVEISEDVFKKYDNLFAEIWIASAFKGATRQLEIIPNAKLHYNNHLSWLNVIKNFPSPHKIKGIALTGWSRYDHMQSICEILPAAIPSLVLCLQTLINYEHSDLFIYSKTKDLTKCTYNKSSTGFILDPTTALTSRLSYNVDDVLNLYTCEFPGAKLYNWLLSLKLVVQFAMSRHERFSDILNPYNLKYKFLNTMAFEEAKKFYAEFDEKLKYLRSIGEKEFDKFFYADLYDELTNVYIVRYVELIESRIAELNKTILPDSAPIRPFDKIQNQLQYVA